MKKKFAAAPKNSRGGPFSVKNTKAPMREKATAAVEQVSKNLKRGVAFRG